MEVKHEELKPATAYYAANGPGYTKVELVRRVPGQLTTDGKVAPETLQLAIFLTPNKPAEVVTVHPAQFKFFDRELEACHFAAMVAYAMYNTLAQKLTELTRFDRPIITPDGIGSAPNRIILPGGSGSV